MERSAASGVTESEYLFEMPPQDLRAAQRKFKQLGYPIWTENKAKLIERYLYFFVQITHGGIYIDAFAGSQEPDNPHMWAAKLVLESKPRWLRRFYLFELNQAKVRALQRLRDNQPARKPKEPQRIIRIYPGDFNKNIGRVLARNPIKPKEPTFCLLDQRTFECDWASVELIANHKTSGNKIELFYFFPNSWLDRSVSGLKDKAATLKRWWGADWQALLSRRGLQRAKYATERFKTELGYEYAYPFPIFERQSGGKQMYFMIHASDHKDATLLMYRAYAKAVGAQAGIEQMEFSAASK